MKPTIFDIVTKGMPLHQTKGHKAGIDILVSDQYSQRATAYYEPGDPIARLLAWKYEGCYFIVCMESKKGNAEVCLIYFDGYETYILQGQHITETLSWYMGKMQTELANRNFNYINEQQFGVVNEDLNSIQVLFTSFFCLYGQSGKLSRGTIAQLYKMLVDIDLFFRNPAIAQHIIGKDESYILTTPFGENTNTYTWIASGVWEGAILLPMGENKVVMQQYGRFVWQSKRLESLFWVAHPGAFSVQLDKTVYPVQGYETNPVTAALTNYKEVIEDTYNKLLYGIKLGNSASGRKRPGGNLQNSVYTGGPRTLTPRHSKLAGNCAAGTYRFMLKWRKGLPAVDPTQVSWDNFPVMLNQEYTLLPVEIKKMVKDNSYFAKLIKGTEKGHSVIRQAAKALLRRARRTNPKST